MGGRKKKKEQRPGCVTRAHQGRWLSKINPNYATRSDFILLNFPSGQKICRPRKCRSIGIQAPAQYKENNPFDLSLYCQLNAHYEFA